MEKDFDISERGAGDLDAVLSTGAGSSEDRQKKAQMMARQIAMNIGEDDDYVPRSSRQAEEPTRERTLPQRPVRAASQGARPKSGSSSNRSRQASSQRSGSSANSAKSANRKYSGSRKSSSKKRRKKRSSGAGAAIGFLLGFVVVLLGVGYFIGLILTNGTFLPNTTINGVDVSKMTLAEATELLKPDEMPGIVITKKDGTSITIDASEFDYTDDTERQVQLIYSNIDRKMWFKSLFSTFNYNFKANVSYDESKLTQALDKIVWGVTEPKNAYIAHTEDGFIIVDATEGDTVDYTKLKPFLLDKIHSGVFNINIAECDCFYKAEVQAEDLQDELAFYQKLGDFTVTIDFDYTKEQLTLEDYSTWMTFSEDGTSYTVNKKEVEQYVGHLADVYDTYGKPRAFHATLQGDITVDQGPQGTYGWKIDQKKTTEELIKVLKSGESTTMDPIYESRYGDDGYAFFTYAGVESARSAESDIGNTYIEVDLTAQHMWYYEKGKVKFETDQIVSGLYSEPSRVTHEGVYEVLEKQSPYKMSGDGYTNVPCSYWIRASYEGVGFHDLSRYAYGGKIYLTDGSHGCINMKYAEVQKLYNLVSVGTPIIMYY